jgi:CO/xanthine dehydrogenase Mo-binding subunit
MNIGTSHPRYDGLNKVTGKEKYAVDYYEDRQGEKCLWLGVKRSAIAPGFIRSLDTSEAAVITGVVIILTHKDIGGANRQGVIRQDQPILAEDRVLFVGEPLALVMAETKGALKSALDAIKVVIDPYPGIYSIKEALAPGAALVHEKNPSGNIVKEVTVTKGRGEEGFDECDVVVDFSFSTPRQEHAYLETEAGWACMENDGTLLIVASTQTPFRDRFEIGHSLGLDPERIHIIAPYLGGAFGGKDGVTVQSYLALGAMHSMGKPVKMWWDREESFLSGVKRLPAEMTFRLGASSDGSMKALSCRLFFDSGAYANLSGEIMTLAIEHGAGPYRIPHTFLYGASVYTHNSLGGPFRGFGVPQVSAGIEQVVQMLAEKLDMDPIELRLKNAIVTGDENGIGVAMIRSTHVVECLNAAHDHELWRTREAWKKDAPVLKRRGIGTACLLHAMGYPKDVPDRAGAKIELTKTGTLRLSVGVVDMGQGNASIFMQMAADLLNQDEEHLELILPDTERTLPCGSASASRCVYVFGNALIEASRTLKSLILHKAASLFHTRELYDLILEPGFVRQKTSGRTIPFARIAALCTDDERIVTSVFTSSTAKEDSRLIYMGPHLLYSYAAHVVRIEVDELTGAVEVKDYAAFTDGGKVLNPQMYDQQIQGSIAQGIGYTLLEDFVLDQGRILTPNLATYTIPTSCDIPDMTSIPIEETEQTGPFGMKGVGEIAINGPMPAIANALADALGMRLHGAPFTAEKILMGLMIDD